jgi:hypothetical protein
VRTPGPLVDELKRGGDEAPLPGEDELTVPEVGTEDEYDERESDGEEGGEDGEEGVLGNDNSGAEDDGRYDERGGEPKEGEDAAKVCPAPSRTSKMERRIGSQNGCTSQVG